MEKYLTPKKSGITESEMSRNIIGEVTGWYEKLGYSPG